MNSSRSPEERRKIEAPHSTQRSAEFERVSLGVGCGGRVCLDLRRSESRGPLSSHRMRPLDGSAGLARFGFFENAEQQQPALYVRGHQKILFDVLATAA